MIATADWAGIVEVVVGCFLTAALALIGWLIKSLLDNLGSQLDQLRQQLKEAGDDIEEWQRQVRGVLGPMWRLMWRTDSVEDFLKERDGYTPPRDTPDWPFKDF